MLQRTYNARLARAVWWNLALLTAGGLLQAACMQGVAPAHGFLAGGVMGLSLVADFLSGGQPGVSVWYLLLSVPFLAAGLFCVNRTFLLYTLYGICATAAWGMVLGRAGFAIPIGNEVYAAVLGGVLLGGGNGLMLRSLGSGGGLSIVSIALKNRWNVPIGQFNLTVNLCIFAFGLLMGYELDRVMASVIMIFISSRMIEHVVGMFNHRKLALIISDRGEEVAEAIVAMERFGLTMVRAKGGYSGGDKEILLTVTNNVVLKRLETLVFSVDPHALFIVENTFHVTGGQFRRG